MAVALIRVRILCDKPIPTTKVQLCRLMRGRSPQISRKSREKFTFKQNLLATLHILVGMVEISRAERVGAKFPAYPCSSVLIRGRFYLLAAEQCSYLTSFERSRCVRRSGMVVYVVFLTNHNPHFSLDS